MNKPKVMPIFVGAPLLNYYVQKIAVYGTSISFVICSLIDFSNWRHYTYARVPFGLWVFIALLGAITAPATLSRLHDRELKMFDGRL